MGISYLHDVPLGARDAILGLTQAFRECPHPHKVNLSIGAYRDEHGVPWVLPSVQKAEECLLQRGEKKEYAPISGNPKFVELALRFAYGDCEPLRTKRVAGVQALSGTGALRLAGEFYARFLPAGTAIYISDPTWGNHPTIFRAAGMEVRTYRYLNRKTQSLDFEGLMTDVNGAPNGSIFLLHACAHNPTGLDPSVEQWAQLSAAILAKRHHVLMDCAYQGFSSGDAEADAAALRQFVRDGHSLLLAQSFAKNFGLYGERVGTLSAVCSSEEEAQRVVSQLNLFIRPMYSSPPIHGALIVAEVLATEELSTQYYAECAEMARRIGGMRTLLVEQLVAVGSKQDWRHITSQIGMFAFTGLNTSMVEAITNDHYIYLTKDGRISLAGINEGNVRYVANAIHAVTDGKQLGS